MGKFKIGDRVRVRDVEVYTLSHGWAFASVMRKYIGKEFIINEDCGGGVYKLDGISYGWAEDWLEPAKPETIVIYRNGDKTIALDKTTGKKAEAKCSKEDTYDFIRVQRSRLSDLSARTKQKKSQSRNFIMGKLCALSRGEGILRKVKYMSLRTVFLNMTMAIVCH